MSVDYGIKDLESAMLERADRLAEEYLERAAVERERIIHEENERLHLREEREVLAAKATAERLFRRRTQAKEIQLQEKIDQLRWKLIQSVKQGLLERLDKLAENEQAYLPLLERLLVHAAQAIDDDELEADLNARDLKRLQADWELFSKRAVPNKTIGLNPDPCTCTGGIRLRTSDNRILVNATFEGRIERFEDELHQVIMERLFSRATDIEDLVHG
jgi:V/A-type H+-transporting ATPase subunit E